MATTAHAQSAYVAATIGADVSRLSHSTSSLARVPAGDSEVISWSLRAGTPVGESWGVELEFVQSGRSHGEVVPIDVLPLVGIVTPPGGSIVSPVPTIDVIPRAIPSPIAFQTDVRRSRYNLDTVAWVRQRVSGSVDLVYLGGIAFSRQRIEITQTFPTFLALFAPGGGAFRTTTIEYGTRPLVGAEARIALTSHVRLVPGIRLQGLDGGWLLRPYAGLGWFF
ncbi:MAG TPA: hypothetical protein VEP46_01815 [Vicinamibacterales bacterium]|nr:hypothetical protein [Vicinamibacterales bacterium]